MPAAKPAHQQHQHDRTDQRSDTVPAWQQAVGLCAEPQTLLPNDSQHAQDRPDKRLNKMVTYRVASRRWDSSAARKPSTRKKLKAGFVARCAVGLSAQTSQGDPRQRTEGCDAAPYRWQPTRDQQHPARTGPRQLAAISGQCIQRHGLHHARRAGNIAHQAAAQRHVIGPRGAVDETGGGQVPHRDRAEIRDGQQDRGCSEQQPMANQQAASARKKGFQSAKG